MPTTRLIQPHFRTLGGMDATTPPHLVDDSKWIFMSGMRPFYGKTVQLPRLNTVSGSTSPEAAFNLPMQSPRFSYLISVNEFSVSRVKAENPGLSLLLDSWPLDPGYQITNAPTIDGVVYANQVWFLGGRVRLRSTDGCSVKEYGQIEYPGNVTLPPQPQTPVNDLTTSFLTAPSPTQITMVNVAGSTHLLFPGMVMEVTHPTNQAWNGDYAIMSISPSANAINDDITMTPIGRTVPTTGLIVFSGPAGTVLRSKNTTQTPPSSLECTFTSTALGLGIGAQFRVIPGQRVRLRGFQNGHFNGVFTVLSTPTAYTFTFMLRGNPGVISDPNTGVMVIEGVSPVPSARFIEQWFDHLVVLNCTYKGQFEPSKLRISDLYKPDVWEPTPENEADEFDLVIAQGGVSSNMEGSGLAKLRDVLFAYTTDAIFSLTYVGLPKVFQLQVAVDGIGARPGSLISSRDFHFFFDEQRFNFYQFDGASMPQPIGDAVIGILSSSITTLTGQYVDYNKTEVSWVVGANSQRFVYNWVSKSWYVLGLEAWTNFFWPFGGRRPAAVDDVAQTINSVVIELTFDDESAFGVFPNSRLYGQSASHVESPAGTIQMDDILMETKDFTTDLQRDVEVDRITIHADYTASSGIDVYVSARNSIQSPLNYKLVGRWTKQTIDGIVSFQAMHGRVFRYKFVPAADTAGLVFYSFTDNVFNVLAER